MFINQHGPNVRDPAVRRAINLHLSNVARQKRPKRYDTAKLDRRHAQQKRRAREAAQMKTLQDLEHQALMLFNARNSINQLEGDFLQPNLKLPEDKVALRACRDFFTIFIPFEARSLGLSQSKGQQYGMSLLGWAYQHEIMFLALAVYRLCNLPVSQDPTSEVRRVIDLLRSRLLTVINDKLEREDVDDMLIQSICLMTIVDDYLGYVEFGRAHLGGLKTMTALRGGLDVVGSSEPGIRENLPHIVMTVNSPEPSLLHHPAFLIDEDHAQHVKQLPMGFQRLVRTQHLSREMIAILTSFMSWLKMLNPDTASSARSWRADTPKGLSALEKCIILALICLADDMTGMADHLSVLLFRKPRQRAEMIMMSEHLWADPRILDCLVWAVTIIATPKKLEIVPQDLRKDMFLRLMDTHPFLTNIESVSQILHKFFLPATRTKALLDPWLEVLDQRKDGLV